MRTPSTQLMVIARMPIDSDSVAPCTMREYRQRPEPSVPSGNQRTSGSTEPNRWMSLSMKKNSVYGSPLANSRSGRSFSRSGKMSCSKVCRLSLVRTG